MAAHTRGPMFAIAMYFLVLVVSALALLRALFEILRSPHKAIRKTRRNVPPACLLDPSLGMHLYMTANGLKFHYIARGNRTKPLMLFVHGFPEFWFSWRHQLRAFSKDYYVVALDMRGCGDTAHPPSNQGYKFTCLRNDIMDLISALNYSSCTLVAHGCGAILAWSIAQNHPKLVNKLIVMNSSHNQIHLQQMGKSWWHFLKLFRVSFQYQMPWVPEVILSLHDYRAFDVMFRGKERGAGSEAAFPPDVLEAYKYTFSRPGALTAALSHYRSFFLERWELQAREPVKTPIEVPTLLIWSDDDTALGTETAKAHTSIASNITIRHIPNSSHWVQQDSPDLVNEYMREWLETAGD